MPPDKATDDPNLHAVCHRTVDQLRAEFTEGLAVERRRLVVDYEISRRVRLLVLPGVKRRTVRLDELRALIDAVESAAGVGR